MSLTPLTALSSVDGRYASRCHELRATFSESGLIRSRVRVEVACLHALAGGSGLAEMQGLSPADLAGADAIAAGLGGGDALEVKSSERDTNQQKKPMRGRSTVGRDALNVLMLVRFQPPQLADGSHPAG